MSRNRPPRSLITEATRYNLFALVLMGLLFSVVTVYVVLTSAASQDLYGQQADFTMKREVNVNILRRVKFLYRLASEVSRGAPGRAYQALARCRDQGPKDETPLFYVAYRPDGRALQVLHRDQSWPADWKNSPSDNLVAYHDLWHPSQDPETILSRFKGSKNQQKYKYAISRIHRVRIGDRSEHVVTVTVPVVDAHNNRLGLLDGAFCLCELVGVLQGCSENSSAMESLHSHLPDESSPVLGWIHRLAERVLLRFTPAFYYVDSYGTGLSARPAEGADWRRARVAAVTFASWARIGRHYDAWLQEHEQPDKDEAWVSVNGEPIRMGDEASWGSYRLFPVANLDGYLVGYIPSTVPLWLAVGLLGVIPLLVYWIFISRRVLKPIALLRAGTDRLAQGELESRIDLHTRDEFGELAKDFNHMAERLQDSHDRLEERVAQMTDELSRRNLELMSANETLRGANEQLRVLDQMKSDFISLVSHELRTPLCSIKACAEILAKDDEVEPEVVKEFLGIINDESDRLTRLVNDVLDLSKIEAGKMTWNVTRVPIQAMVGQTIQSISSMASAHHVALAWEPPTSLPAVHGDRDRLIQVLCNLLSNAIKFSPTGACIEVRAWQESGRQVAERIQAAGWDDDGAPPSSSSAFVCFSVADHGRGIDEADRRLVFEKFKQVGDTLTEKPQGTGLGLPICKQIVEHLGGRIWLTSEPGVGTTFYFTVPVAGEQAPEASPTDSATAPAFVPVATDQSPPPDGEASAGTLPTVLVVDDEAALRRYLSLEMQKMGFDVVEATDGIEALAKVRSHKPSLITLDIRMPNLKGTDVATLLKSRPETKEIPIVMISVADEQGNGLEAGADFFVQKPFERETLLQIVRQAMERQTPS